MTLSRDRRRKKKKYTPPSALAKMLATCLNCGEPGPHFVSPSFGDPGFYICTKKA